MKTFPANAITWHEIFITTMRNRWGYIQDNYGWTPNPHCYDELYGKLIGSIAKVRSKDAKIDSVIDIFEREIKNWEAEVNTYAWTQ